QFVQTADGFLTTETDIRMNFLALGQILAQNGDHGEYPHAAADERDSLFLFPHEKSVAERQKNAQLSPDGQGGQKMRPLARQLITDGDLLPVGLADGNGTAQKVRAVSHAEIDKLSRTDGYGLSRRKSEGIYPLRNRTVFQNGRNDFF